MLEKLIKLIFPPKCIFCEEVLYYYSIHDICNKCNQSVNYFELDRSWPMRNIFTSEYCDGVVCVFEYEGIVRGALKRFKFHNKPSYYRTLANLLTERLFCLEDGFELDISMGVPLHKDRQDERGFNQAQLISKEVSKRLGIEDASKAIERVRKTKTQSLLKKSERIENVKGAFVLNDYYKISGKKILLIDDILTTGSTIDECARILKEAGAALVIVGVIATGRRV